MLLLLPLVCSLVLVVMFMFDGDATLVGKFIVLVAFVGSFAIRLLDPNLALVGTLVQVILCLVLMMRLKFKAA